MKKALQVCVLTWLASVALGLWFATTVDGTFNPGVLVLPAVFPIAVSVSTVVSLGVMPIAIWSSRTGWHNVRLYGSALWVLLAAYTAVVIPRTPGPGVIGLVALAAIGVLAIGFVRRRP